MDFVQKFSIIRFVSFLDMCIFISYIYNVYKKNGNKTAKIENTYLAFCYYNIVVVILAFVLIFLGILDPTSNEIPLNSITEDNMENNNFQEYSFPGYLSVALKDKRLFADFDVPLLTGLSHEPHVLCYLILPGLFLSFKKNFNEITKGTIFILYSAVVLISFSSTAFICFGTVMFVDFVWRVFVKKKYKFLTLFVPIIYIVYNWGDLIVQAITEELIMKTMEQTSSMETSTSVLEYIVSPSGLFGTGNSQATTHGRMEGGNIGYITSILDLFFYAIVIFKTMKCSLSKDYKIHFVGLACLYYFLHFLKVPIFSLEYPYFMFMLFLLICQHSSNSALSMIFWKRRK